jgi:hypothetical protein
MPGPHRLPPPNPPPDSLRLEKPPKLEPPPKELPRDELRELLLYELPLLLRKEPPLTLCPPLL